MPLSLIRGLINLNILDLLLNRYRYILIRISKAYKFFVPKMSKWSFFIQTLSHI